jgi:crotonobetainyl-CoA:carnitine CoA-transferase CaiB-like acyl-CoA transferase
MQPLANSLPLDGIHVLDFSRVLAGPFCTMLLGDLGADVIKVEHPQDGDETREWGPPWFGERDAALSAYFISVNRNKRSLTLNLKTVGGREIARQLAARCHILIENFKAGDMAKFGLGFDEIHRLNPGLVYCSITGFGQYGPYRNRPGYDFVIQAMSGLMSITGPRDGPSYKVGVAVSDVFTGLYALTVILAALRHSERTGEGQHIDLALLDSQIAALINVASNYLISGQTPTQLGNEHPNIVPYQTFSAKDMDFVLAVGNDRQFGALCHFIKRPDLANDPRFATNPQRIQNRIELTRVLQNIFRQRPAREWVDGLSAAGVPAGLINDVATVLNDPHVQARGLVQSMPTEFGPLPLVGSPALFSATPAEVRLPPPRLGQHTDEILRDVLQLSPEDITLYRRVGAI